MFGTMGFSELIIILVIVLIIFGAGRLPQIGEGVGKALKGFKKEVNEMPPPVDPNAPDQQATPQISSSPEQTASPAQSSEAQSESSSAGAPSNQPYQPGARTYPRYDGRSIIQRSRSRDRDPQTIPGGPRSTPIIISRHSRFCATSSYNGTTSRAIESNGSSSISSLAFDSPPATNNQTTLSRGQ